MAFGSGSLGELIVRISADASNLNKGLVKAKNNIAGFAKANDKTLRDIKNAFRDAGLIIAAFGALSIKAAVDFESAFAGVRKTVDATEKEFAQLREGLIQLSKEIPISAKELAKIQEIAGQLGVRGVKNLTQFTKNVALIAKTTDLTEEAASFAFARISSIVQEPIKNIDKMASSVVALGNNFEVVESEILTFAQRIAASGKNAGLTTQEILGVSAAFASVGIQAEAGGTAVSDVLLELQKQGKVGIGSLIEFIDELQAKGADAGIELEKMGFSSKRTQRAFLSLAGTNGKLNKTLDLSNKAFEENTALQIEAAKRFETTASRIELMKNNVTALQISIGEKLLPSFQKFLDLTVKLIDKTNEWLQPTPLQIYTKQIAEVDKELNKLLEINKRYALIGGSPFIVNRIAELQDLRSNLSSAITQEREFAEQKRLINEQSTAETPSGGGEGEDDPRLVAEISFINKVNALNATANEKRLTESQLLAKKTEANFKAASISIESAFSSSLASIIDGSATAEDAFKGLGKALIGIIAQLIAKQIIAATIGKALQTATAVFTIGIAASLAAAWTLPALLASIATLGGATATGTAAQVAATTAALAESAVNKAAVIGTAGLAEGTDTVPAMLSPGEMVIPRTFADALRAGILTLGGPDSESKSRTKTDVNIEMQNQFIVSNIDDVEGIAEELGEQVQTVLSEV